MSKKTALLLFIFIVIYSVLSFTVFPALVARIMPTKKGTTSKIQPKPVEKKPVMAGLGRLVGYEPTLTPIPPTPMPSSLIPAEFIISKLHIRTAVERVGQTKTFNMDVPKNAGQVAWYVYGAKPGEVGNAVINGHYDTPSGRPAVFYNLRNLEPKDEIEVISEDGIKSVFVVTEKAVVPYDQFPDEYVFHTRPGTNLNLITCDGVWDPIKKNYSTRVVIYSSLKGTI